MHLLDAGKSADWAATFTENGTFALPGRAGSTRGRTRLAAAARAAFDDLAAKGETHRHWHGMITVDPIDSATVRAQCYALVFATARGGEPRLHRVCTCTDTLVREGGRWLVAHRVVTRDGYPD
jgi:SnoaL-like domain